MSSVSSNLHYFVPPKDGSRAYISVNVDPATGEREKNYGEEIRKMEIEDIRGTQDEYTLDKNGFQLFHRPSAHKEFTDDAKIREEYYPESVELIKELTGASQVVVFDHTIRRRDPSQLGDSPQKRQPVAGVHVDQTAKAAVGRVHRHLPPTEAPKLVKGRFQIINLWRPIAVPAFDWPLAFCDFNSVDTKEGGDCMPTALRYPDWEGETMGVKFNPAHKWKYVRGMTPDEFVLLKCSDSKEGVAQFTPHTAFEDPTTPPDAPYRQSIELRTLVFYD